MKTPKPCSLGSALKTARTERYNERKRQQKIKQFDALPYNEKQRLYNKFKGRKRHLCFITEWNKVEIVNKYLKI